MSVTSEFGYWCVSPARLVGVDALKARDIMLDCFYAAQHETFKRAKQNMGTGWDEDAVRKSVAGAIRLAFDHVGADWDAPTKRDLEAVMDVLAKKASSWGTPQDIIEHHHKEMQRVLRWIEN